MTWASRSAFTPTNSVTSPGPTPSDPRTLACTALVLLDTWPDDRPLEAIASNTDEVQRRTALIHVLDQLQRHPALAVKCARCGKNLGFVAIKPGTAHVVSANRRKRPKDRYGGVWDLADIEPHRGRYEGWVEDSLVGKGSVQPTGSTPGRATGWPDRRTYTCRCNAQYTKTDRELLRLILTALRNNDRAIYLGRAARDVG